MKNEFSYDVLKNKYGKRVGNYKGRDVIVRSKYDDLGDNVYVLYDCNNAFIVDGYWIANISEDGNLNRKWESPWKKQKRASAAARPLACPEGDESGENDINLDVDTSLADSLLESAYNDILSDLMFKE
jgi:hypothetical protein